MQENYIEGLDEGISKEELELAVDGSAEPDGQQVPEADSVSDKAKGKKEKKVKKAKKANEEKVCQSGEEGGCQREKAVKEAFERQEGEEAC